MVRPAKVEQNLLTVGDNVVEAGRFDTLKKGRQKPSDESPLFWA